VSLYLVSVVCGLELAFDYVEPKEGKLSHVVVNDRRRRESEVFTLLRIPHNNAMSHQSIRLIDRCI
jgi:hypothetical protein